MLAVTSSHFGSAEKEFRFPLGYANQRPLSAHWTVTGSGAFLVTAGAEQSANIPGDAGTGQSAAMPGQVKISGVTVGKIVDLKLWISG